jgi:phosphoribosyl 1,2-cyclic phosphodiesterase
VKVTFWGTRGSIATPGRETNRYGGDTSCVAVTGAAPDHLIVLDAGTGIRRLGLAIPEAITRIDVLLTHLHLDHIVGLGFFVPLFRSNVTITIWGPRATTSLLDRLGRYLSPPLFPVRLRDVQAVLELRDVPDSTLTLGEFTVTAEPVIHPDPALGFRIVSDGQVLAYLPDHEPALGPSFPSDPAWTSGAAVASRADLLIHDAQYDPAEYADRIGWGHSSVMDAVAFAELVEARTLALFHHDPGRNDAGVDTLLQEAQRMSGRVKVVAAREDASIEIAPGGA